MPIKKENNVQNLQTLIVEAEEILSSFYGIDLQQSVNEYLIFDLEGLGISMSDGEKEALTLYEKNADGLFIGVYFSKEILNRLELIKWSFELDSLSDLACVFEEVSHFHHILNSLSTNLEIKIADLEYLAEIEKVIMLAEFMIKRFGHDFSEEIFYLSFAFQKFPNAPDQNLYIEASNKAQHKIANFVSTSRKKGRNFSVRQYREQFRQEYFRKAS